MSNTDIVFVSRVIESNRITVPKNIAKLLNISKGDYIEVRVLRVIRVHSEAPEMTGRKKNQEEVVLENG